ncbi:MAG TPA: hypothetical protein VGG96_04120 [Steroidobacteraceae bacterium]|jgi:hypothetical protein
MRNRFRGLVPALALAALPAISSAGLFVGVSVNLAPPPLPVYVQPPCPEPGYLWTPGYWAWNDGAYYWVPGTWVEPPDVGLLWTPGYWGWGGGLYMWHAGYWGPHVGFYGGVDYGFGYDGAGFVGGYWRGRDFFYNRAVMRVGPTFARNVYYHPVAYHSNYRHVSFNGGPGGVRARASHQQMAAEHEHHFAFTSGQQRQQRMAFADHSLRADYNHGRPPVAATARPAMFHGNGVFAARAAGGPVHFSPARSAAPMRSDRPSWASGQNDGAHAMARGAYGHPGSARPEQQRFESRPPGHNQGHNFEARPQSHNFEAHGSRPMQRPQPQFHEQARSQQPQFHQNNFRAAPHGAPARGAAPHPQQRGGGERPHHPPDNRGHNR